MKSWILELRKFIGTIIFIGLIGALIAFVYAIKLPKEHLVVGKIVIFPSSCNGAQHSLGYETANAVSIIESAAFQKNTFQDFEKNFLKARRIEDSSIVEISFSAKENEITEIEDLIVKMPETISLYAKYIYEGSPFKYRLLADPEVSVSPVKPNLAKYLLNGFLTGAGMYLLYWALNFFMRPPKEEEFSSSKESVSSAAQEISASSVDVYEKYQRDQKNNQKTKSKKEISEKTFPTSPQTGKAEKIEPAEAPSNLPVAEVSEETNASKIEEPTDEEVRERLNKLMRGEL